jgi:hypothetical protein
VNLTLDLNSILTGLCLAGILYSVRMLNILDKAQALTSQQAAAQQLEMISLRDRLSKTEAEVAAIKLHVATFTASAGLDTTQHA